MHLLLSQIQDVEPISYGFLFAKMVIAMVVIIAAAFLCIKFILPRFTQVRRKKHSDIQILDYQPLEARKSIYLIRIEDKKVALGVTDHSIAKLAEWEYHEEESNA
jgi:flagellar biogenesis protein FliO